MRCFLLLGLWLFGILTPNLFAETSFEDDHTQSDAFFAPVYETHSRLQAEEKFEDCKKSINADPCWILHCHYNY